MLWPGGGRGGDLYRMGPGLLIFARANCDADQLFHGALLSTVNYLLIVIAAEESYTTSLTPAVPALAAALFAAGRLRSEVPRGPAKIRRCAASAESRIDEG